MQNSYSGCISHPFVLAEDDLSCPKLRTCSGSDPFKLLVACTVGVEPDRATASASNVSPFNSAGSCVNATSGRVRDIHATPLSYKRGSECFFPIVRPSV